LPTFSTETTGNTYNTRIMHTNIPGEIPRTAYQLPLSLQANACPKLPVVACALSVLLPG